MCPAGRSLNAYGNFLPALRERDAPFPSGAAGWYKGPMPPIDTADLKPVLAHVAAGRSLSEAEAEAAFDIIMSGNATASQVGALLMALRVRGETVEEIAGAARTMRAKAVVIGRPP